MVGFSPPFTKVSTMPFIVPSNQSFCPACANVSTPIISDVPVGIAFYLYNPLCGGWLTGRYKDMNVQPEAGSRFDPNRPDGQSKNYRARYWSETHFRALSIIEKATKEHQLTIAECALRWINHHSLLKAGYGDAIIIGASSKDHVESNLGDLEKGPLPAPVVEALDERGRSYGRRSASTGTSSVAFWLAKLVNLTPFPHHFELSGQNK
ncbi:Aldo kereductase [Rhizoctonia solani]|uniref:Aldo kereductase n=1 Tax=Rhizoctonia solani TaxID=456999 RepID=A0A8H7M762_9AGAM|nr:Aldo kereductase [Rhizoctonia solani]